MNHQVPLKDHAPKPPKPKPASSKWTVLEWQNEPASKSSVPMKCPRCGRTADCPSGVLEGGKLVGLDCDGFMVFSPSVLEVEIGFMPSKVRCGNCHSELGFILIDTEEDLTISLTDPKDWGWK